MISVEIQELSRLHRAVNPDMRMVLPVIDEHPKQAIMLDLHTLSEYRHVDVHKFFAHGLSAF